MCVSVYAYVCLYLWPGVTSLLGAAVRQLSGGGGGGRWLLGTVVVVVVVRGCVRAGYMQRDREQVEKPKARHLTETYNRWSRRISRGNRRGLGKGQGLKLGLNKRR